MFAPGGIALAMSVIVALFMKESPEKLGYPPVGEGKPKPKAAAAAGAHWHPTHACPIVWVQDMGELESTLPRQAVGHAHACMACLLHKVQAFVRANR